MVTRSRRISAPALLLALAASALLSGPALAKGFTAEQAEAGKLAYNSQCAQCHGFQLEGPDAPGLVGSDIMQNWDTAEGLYDFISVAMPPSAPGLLGEDTYVDIVAYIMWFNGAEPGDEAMTADPDLLASISLPAETTAGPRTAQTTSVPEAASDVPQAYTWGKPLPGGTQSGAATGETAVPQAYTWGKKLPGAAN